MAPTQSGSAGPSGTGGDGGVAATSRMAMDVYDPNQDVNEKREVRAKYRALQADLEHRRQEGLANIGFSELTEVIKDQNELYTKVKAPSEGVLDARLLVHVADMGHALAKTLRTDKGGFDVSDFITKVAQYIGGSGSGGRSQAAGRGGKGKGKGKARARARRAAAGSDDEDDDDEDEELEEADDYAWDRLGRLAARHTRRAPTMDFLNGPLKADYVKRQVARRTKIDRADVVEKPQELGEGDIEKSANETTKQVMSVHKLLAQQGPAGVSMFDFAIDPTSFGNTVENLFYISFLIRDGRTELLVPGQDGNEDGQVPLLRVREPAEEEDYAAGLQRKQIVLEMDMATWAGIIKTHGIRQSIIPARVNEQPRQNAGGRWYG